MANLSRSSVIATLRALASCLKASTGAECVVVELNPDQWYGFIQDYNSDDDEEDFDPEWIDVAGPASSADKALRLLLKRHANPGASDEIPFSDLNDASFKFWSKLATSLNKKISVPETRAGGLPKQEAPAPAPKPSAGMAWALSWAVSRFSPSKTQTREEYMGQVRQMLANANPEALAAVKDLVEGKPSNVKKLWEGVPIEDGATITLENAFRSAEVSWKKLEEPVTTRNGNTLVTGAGAFFLGSSDMAIVKGKLGFYIFNKEPSPAASLSFWRIRRLKK